MKGGADKVGEAKRGKEKQREAERSNEKQREAKSRHVWYKRGFSALYNFCTAFVRWSLRQLLYRQLLYSLLSLLKHDLTPSSLFILPSSFFLLPSSFSLLPPHFFLLPSSLFPVPCCFFLPSSFFLLPSSVFRLPTNRFVCLCLLFLILIHAQVQRTVPHTGACCPHRRGLFD